jgi:hypothetical protein
MVSSALEYFLSSRSDVVQLELIEISHPSFTQVYRRVRNHRDGVTVKHTPAGPDVFYAWYPMQVVELSDRADLDSGLRISFGDLGEVLPKELDAVTTADDMGTKPTIVYRVYRSDDLTEPLIGPVNLEATTFSFTREGASFEASAPYANRNRTGETYNITRFPMLRGFIK